MRTILTVILAIVLPIVATWAIVSHDKSIDWLAVGIMLLLAVVVRRPPQWWVGSLLFTVFGVAHLFERWQLKAHNLSSSALDTFGPGYLLMAVLFYVWHRWTRSNPRSSV